MERVGAENTYSIIVTIFKPLQIRLHHALSTQKNIPKRVKLYLCTVHVYQTYSGVIADHAVLTHIHAVNKAEEISYSSLWTLAQSHSVSLCSFVAHVWGNSPTRKRSFTSPAPFRRWRQIQEPVKMILAVEGTAPCVA